MKWRNEQLIESENGDEERIYSHQMIVRRAIFEKEKKGFKSNFYGFRVPVDKPR